MANRYDLSLQHPYAFKFAQHASIEPRGFQRFAGLGIAHM